MAPMRPDRNGVRMSLFVADGDLLVPTDLARGPWSPDALHGGPTAAITVRAIERHLHDTDIDTPWEVARVTLELLRPVPVVSLRCSARTVRPGRKVTLVETSIEADGREVARSVSLAIRRAAIPLPSRIRALPPPDAPDTAATAAVPDGAGEWPAFHNGGVEMRFVSGAWRQPGPAVVWIRLRVPVVDDEEPSPAVRAAAAADFGNGVSSELEFGAWRFLNPELTIHLARPPIGEWIGLDARTILGELGAGMAESALADQDGVFGRAVQSLLIEAS